MGKGCQRYKLQDLSGCPISGGIRYSADWLRNVQALICDHLAELLQDASGPTNLQLGVRRFTQAKVNRQVARRGIAYTS